MQKKMSETGEAKAMNFLKRIATVCEMNGDHELTTMDCLIEITAEIVAIAKRNRVPIIAVMREANLEKNPALPSKRAMSGKGKAEAADLWQAVREYFEEDSVPDITFSNCVGSFISTVETVAKEEDVPISYVLDYFMVCMLDVQNGMA